ncbi:kelch-like protein diablo [Pungitius pungitius]|uniref:kelch-like protein diablo n=1 Tax=Pungitius pungitius TaxID=134920 RepID=UPI002E10F61A
MGGSDGEVALDSVERYSPVDGAWSMCAHMLSAREDAGCAAYLGRIYVAGGRDELNLKLCRAERLDPDTQRWTPVRRMRSKRDDTSLVVFNGALMAVGGSDGVTSLKTVEAYCHETNEWRHFGSMKSKHPGGRWPCCAETTLVLCEEERKGPNEPTHTHTHSPAPRAHGDVV